MPICIGNKEYKDIFVGNKRIYKAYVGNNLVYQYDIIAPVLTVEQPRGLSADSPEYISKLTNYKIWGYATDAAGNDVTVYVNNEKVAYFPPQGENGHWVCNAFDLSMEEGEVYKYDIYAVDSAGNKTETITRYVCYDASAPELTVANTLGTSTDSPFYIQSDDTYGYIVTGTVSDNNGIESVKVNGTDATVNGTNWSVELPLVTNTTHTINVVATDNVGKSVSVTGYVRIEAYYQQAARVAGTTAQSSLNSTLTNDSVCAAMSTNSEACNIMKTHYSTEMTEYVGQQDIWTNGLNKLCYNCKLKFYLIMNKIGAEGFCNTTNGMNVYHKADDGGYALNISDIEVDLTGYSKVKMVFYTKNTYSEGYTKVGFTGYAPSDKDSDYDKYYKNNIVFAIDTPDHWNSDPFVTEFQIDPVYKRLFIGMTLPFVNGYAQTGETYFTYVAVMP